jgi:hypothetical protein
MNEGEEKGGEKGKRREGDRGKIDLPHSKKMK